MNIPTNCQRCGQKLVASIMSVFNTDTICIDCSDLEKRHPEYQKARDAELAAVMAGDYNFPGIKPKGWRP